MLDRHIFISHLLRLILRMNQDIIQILPHKNLPALHLGALAQQLFHAVHKQSALDAHFF